MRTDREGARAAAVVQASDGSNGRGHGKERPNSR